jgi:hypothetical protein
MPGCSSRRALEAAVPVVVGRSPCRAAHVDHVPLAADLLEEPLGAEVGVLLLVVRDDVGRGLGHRLVNGDHDDPGVGRLLDRVVDPFGVRGVHHNGVHARLDQVADVLELPRRVRVAVSDVEALDHPRVQRLRLHRADHLLAPAVALHGVRDADGVHVLGRGYPAQSRQERGQRHAPIQSRHVSSLTSRFLFHLT